MKKALLSAAICFVTGISSAQLNTNLTMIANPPGTLIDWDNKTLTYIVVGGTGLIVEAKIKTEIKTLDGTVAATTNLARARKILAGGNNLILYVGDVMPLDVMTFNGKFKTSLERSGKLPADNYQICVQLVNPTDYRPLSEAKCRNFNLAAFQLAIPTMPYNEQVLKAEQAQTAITFRWAPVAPPPSFPVTYRLLVFEVLNSQTPMQALRSNHPLLAKDIIGTTQYIWQPQLGMIDCCPAGTGNHDSTGTKPKTFIWTIQCLDSFGNPFGDGNINGDGISEPNIFYVSKGDKK